MWILGFCFKESTMCCWSLHSSSYKQEYMHVFSWYCGKLFLSINAPPPLPTPQHGHNTKRSLSSYIPGADAGFFLGGGALVFCSTSTPVNHIVFFLAEYQLYKKTAGNLRGVRTPCTLPLDPPLHSHESKQVCYRCVSLHVTERSHNTINRRKKHQLPHIRCESTKLSGRKVAEVTFNGRKAVIRSKH